MNVGIIVIVMWIVFIVVTLGIIFWWLISGWYSFIKEGKRLKARDLLESMVKFNKTEEKTEIESIKIDPIINFKKLIRSIEL